MKKIHLLVLLLGKAIQRHTKLLLRVAFPLLILATIIVKVSPSLLSSKISQGYIGFYHQTNLPLPIARLLSSSLIILDKDGLPRENLLASWQAKDDGKTYIFKLKPNLYWDDGQKLLASDIYFAIPDVQVLYPDEETLEFKLADSYSPFPTFLNNPIFRDNLMVGIGGKFRVKSSDINRGFLTKLTLQPQDQNSSLPEVIVRFYPDEKIAKTAFDLGQVDSLWDYSSTESISQITKIKKVADWQKIVAVFYNTKDSILSDKNFRKALTAATPKIIEENLAKTSLPESSWAFNNQVKDLVGDQEVAKSYLEKVANGKKETITLIATPQLSSVGEKIINSWKQQGISAVLRVESGVPQNFQALLTTQAILADPDQYGLWHSTQNTNIAHYSSARVDKDLEDGRKSLDLVKRKEKYLDFQKILADDAPATFLYFPTYNILYRVKVEKELNSVSPLQFPQN